MRLTSRRLLHLAIGVAILASVGGLTYTYLLRTPRRRRLRVYNYSYYIDLKV